MGVVTWFKDLFESAPKPGGTAPTRDKPRQFTEALGVTIDADEEQWRRLTGDSLRDLSPMTQERMQEMALYLWRGNVLANRMVELPVAYLLADGVTMTVADEDAQKWIDAFWDDPINKMDLKLPKKVRELAIYGEQCWPVFVNDVNGHVRLGYLDPGAIATVVTDPDNIEQPIGVVTKRDRKGDVRRYKIIVNGPETVFSNRTQEIRETFDTGECFYFTVNDLSNASRGQSDLLAATDWLDGYDHAMFGELDRWDFLRAFIWDVELKGATPEEVKKRAGEITSPKPGSTRVHNDAEKWTAVTPALQAGDSAEEARLFRNHILGGLTIPEHWYGGGGDVNRATGDSMGEPTFKVLSMRQAIWKHILVELGTFQIRMRARALFGAEPVGDEWDDFRPVAVFPEMTARDTSKYAAALQQVVAAGTIAIERGVLSEETVVTIVASVAGQLGIEIDPKEELEKAGADALRRAEADLFRDTPEEPEEADDAITA